MPSCERWSRLLLEMNDNKLITLQLGTQVIGLIAEDYASLDLFIKVGYILW